MLSRLAAFLTAVSISADNWPAWRGPHGTGVCSEQDLPVHWSQKQNVRWRTPLPDRGNSTPIVWGNRVFVTQAVESEGRREVMCFDRTTGELMWKAGVTGAGAEPTHQTNPFCAASPVTDGERVIASFASAGLYCYDLDGNEMWRRNLGTQRHIWGNGASPILYSDLCILNYGPGEGTFLIAVDKRTGKTVWTHDEPGGDSGETKPGQNRVNWVGSFTTPIVISSDGHDELIMTFPNRVCAFDPSTGKELWTCEGLNPLVYTSPIHEDGIIVGMGGYSGSALAVRAGGKGNVTQTRRLWRHTKTKQRIGSGVIHDGFIYILNDPGVAECFELQSGKRLWEERLRGTGPKSTSWSSMVLSENKLYAINQSGDTFVLRASPDFELLSTNPLGETAMSSLAVSNGDIFIRTYESLWCISERNDLR